jgi:hypothetical protein
VTPADAFPGFDGAREVATDAGHDPADAVISLGESVAIGYTMAR